MTFCKAHYDDGVVPFGDVIVSETAINETTDNWNLMSDVALTAWWIR